MAKYVMKSVEEEITNTNPEEILVIGAGLPRTGTLSLKTALMKLYKGKCYNMKEVFEGDQEDLDIWMNGIKKKNTPADWRQYFKKKGYVAGVDYPYSLFWKEIADAYPNAKVVLSSREPRTWYKSVVESIWLFNELARKSWTFRIMLKMFDPRKGSEDWIELMMTHKGYGMKRGMGEAIEGGEETAEKYFLEWEDSVKATIPSDRLLVHKAVDGWEPLCLFLGVDVPTVPYPRVNDTAAIQQEVKNLKMMNYCLFYGLPGLLLLLGLLIFKIMA
ncbi:uncharacterized protein LOC111714641 [Eurytemora carolleeae]|uniref:uncharacterized protein LOC111714641 n=1 Tax=Eurytemora carolleeae TaxID=1294199 RepID=UPI000C77C6A0|nr:uncharacterized protein LOC111714641 [Eurytemora carolleeae]|eukprot:XP_023345560.1 uncharacterized protein LOC111714641 [Eurytemora affinis]